MSLADLAALQLGALPDAAAGEEDAAAVDLAASALRAERHELALRTAAPAPDYADRAGYAQFVADFIDALGLANFSGAEVVAVHARTARNGAKNRLPKPWGVLRLALVLIRAQRLRDAVGPLRPTSLHRILAYDLAIGGVGPTGQHPACAAADLKPLAATPYDLLLALRAMRGDRVRLNDQQVRAFEAFRKATGYRGAVFSGRVAREKRGDGVQFDGGCFTSSGGEGLYSSFVHGDLRGYLARWNG